MTKPDFLLRQCDLDFFYILLLIPPSTYLMQMALFVSSNHLTEIYLNQINFRGELSKDLALQ